MRGDSWLAMCCVASSVPEQLLDCHYVRSPIQEPADTTVLASANLMREIMANWSAPSWP